MERGDPPGAASGDERAGPEAAFERLFREHAGAVRSYSLRRTDPVEAQEVLSETFLVAWRRRDDVPADALPWLLGIARLVLANRRRTARRNAELRRRLSAQPADRSTPGAGAGAGARDALLGILERMPEAEREALRLLAWESLTPAQAAEVLGCSRATLAVRLHRARKRFRRALRELDDGEGAPTSARLAAADRTRR
jgi:RNA polymerase sigma-70 factor (ECF subfamily)